MFVDAAFLLDTTDMYLLLWKENIILMKKMLDKFKKLIKITITNMSVFALKNSI